MKFNKGMMKAARAYVEKFHKIGYSGLKDASRKIREDCKDAYVPRETAQIYVRREYADQLQSGKFLSLDERMETILSNVIRRSYARPYSSEVSSGIAHLLVIGGSGIGMGGVILLNDILENHANNPGANGVIGIASVVLGGWIGKKISDKIEGNMHAQALPLEGLPSYEQIQHEAFSARNGNNFH